MAYLPDFKHDLFVSYRRSLNEGPDRWVASFQSALELQLKQFGCDQVKFWRDEERLYAGDDWRRCLTDALEGAAIYLAIISRSYLDSRECRNELDLMLAKLHETGVKASRKIVPVYKQPPRSEADVPLELQDKQRCEFFERRKDLPLGFSELSAHPDDLAFQQRLAWLAQSLTVVLESLRGAAIQRFEGRVFVADVEPALYRDRDDLGADLLHHRIAVVPEREYLWNSHDIESTIRADLEGALLSIHLVAPEAMRTAELVQQARLQLMMAIDAMSNQGRPPPLVWIDNEGGAGDPLRAFLNEINGPLADRGIEILVGGLEELKSLVHKRLPPPAAEVQGVEGGEVVVLVHEGDLPAFAALRARLLGDFDVEAVPAFLRGNAPRDAVALERAFRHCPRCLIFWGAQSEEWVQEALRLSTLVAQLSRERVGVLVAAPKTQEKGLFMTKKARVFSRGGADDEALRDFCSER